MISWAILGTSFISGTVAESIKRSDGSRIAAVAGRTAKSVTAFASQHDIPKSFLSYEQAMADDEIDVVYIGLPNHVHLPMVRQAAAAGKAILSEKSLTTTYPDAEALVECVRSADVFFLEGLMYLSHPIFGKVAEVLAEGRLGPVRSVNAAYAADIKDVVNPAGCGTLYNLGCYPASLLHFVIQQACGQDAFAEFELNAVGNLNSDGNICDAAASVKFKNGILATLQSTDSYGRHSAFEIVGERGVLRFCTNPWLPSAGENVFEISQNDLPAEQTVVSDGLDAFDHQIRAVETCLKRGVRQAPRPSPRWSDSLEIMRFLTEWERSVRS